MSEALIPPRTLCYAYDRFSSDVQAAGDSKRRQVARREVFVQKYKLTLDTKLRMSDHGLSGFHGDNLKSGDLGKFLKLTQENKIKSGSVLHIENFDRMTRAEITDAQGLFLDLIRAGIVIAVTGDGYERILSKQIIDKQEYLIYEVAGELIRAHRESQRKSELVSAAWKRKQRDARQDGRPVTSRCPTWIRINADGQYELIPEKVKLLKETIIPWALAGQGCLAIARKLNKAGIPSFSTRKKRPKIEFDTEGNLIESSSPGDFSKWNFGTLQHILKSKALIGYYQPCDTRSRKQVPDGEPIKLYPVAISEGTYYRIQNAIRKRQINIHGRQGESLLNLFGRLLVSGSDGRVMRVHRDQRKQVLMFSGNSLDGVEDYISFNYTDFENAFLLLMNQIKIPDDVSDTKGQEIAATEGEMMDVRQRLKQLERELNSANVKAIGRVAKVIGEWEAKEKMLERKLEELKSSSTAPPLRAARKVVADLGVEMVNMKRDDPGYMELREKVRAAIMNAVTAIRVYIGRHRSSTSSGSRRETSACVGVVSFSDGSMRLFACRRSRWHYKDEPPAMAVIPQRLKSISGDWARLTDGLAKRSHAEFEVIISQLMHTLKSPEDEYIVPRVGTKKSSSIADILLDR